MRKLTDDSEAEGVGSMPVFINALLTRKTSRITSHVGFASEIVEGASEESWSEDWEPRPRATPFQYLILATYQLEQADCHVFQNKRIFVILSS